MNSRNGRNGFTLIELMVVIAIIALLISILLPSLSAARAHAKAVACSSNLHHVSLAMANYLYVSKGTYPVSYAYPDNADGQWSAKNQNEGKPFGYVHWSHFLYDSGEVNDKAFECPLYDHGGASRTNPGRKAENWESGQADQNGDPTATDRSPGQRSRSSPSQSISDVVQTRRVSARP